MSFPNISKHFFAKHVLVVTASAKYYSFSLLRRPHQQIITLEIAYVLIIFNPDQDGGDKKPPNSFSPVLLNVGISPKNSLIFSFNPFATLV